MDNLTHSLVGALIGQMGLKRKTGLAMPTLIIAANIPDIDAVATLLGGYQHLAIRRGITHGPIAMVLLPLMLWAIMLWFDRRQTRRGKRPAKRLPIHKGWLLGLAYIGCLSHPLFDWFNSYGIRLLEPFSSQWFYGDTLFIVDIWIWVLLIGGLSLSIKRERRSVKNLTRPALVSAFLVIAYIITNIGISSAAVSRFREIRATESREMGGTRFVSNLIVVANPVPIAFWKRDVLWRLNYDDEEYVGEMEYDFFSPMARGPYRIPSSEDEFRPISHGWPSNKSTGLLELVRQSSDGKAFLFWSRMPVFEVDGTKVLVSDQRFTNPMVSDRFTVTVEAKR